MREMLSTTAALYGQGAGEKVALITDGRFSGATRVRRPCRPEAAIGGPIGLIRDGDIIEIDAVKGSLDVKLSEELAKRKAQWKPRENDYGSGYLWKYAQQVGPPSTALCVPAGRARKSAMRTFESTLRALLIGGLSQRRAHTPLDGGRPMRRPADVADRKHFVPGANWLKAGGTRQGGELA